MGSGCGLTAAQRIADVLPEFPKGSQLTSVGAAIAGDCDILVYLYDRKYFISHCLSLLFFSWLHLTCGILVPQLGIEPSAVTTRSPNLWSLLFSLSVVSDSATPGFPVPHHSCWSLLKLMSIELAMPSNHLYQGIP